MVDPEFSDIVAEIRRRQGFRFVGATTYLGTQPISESTLSPRRVYFATKRTIDVLSACILLLLAAPFLLLAAVAIKLDSPGPVIFRQQRLRGRRIVDHGEVTWVVEPFTFYKMRTMVADADSSPHQEYMTAYITGNEQWFDADA